jgi:hypothetical protein
MLRSKPWRCIPALLAEGSAKKLLHRQRRGGPIYDSAEVMQCRPSLPDAV